VTAPLIFTNSLIVTPALVGPVPQFTQLNFATGSSFSGTWAWIAGGVGVDPSSATPLVTFRQLPTDTPLATVTGSLTASGQVTYLAAVPNFPYLPASLDNEALAPVLITIYPFKLAMTVAGVGLVAAVPYCQWSFDMTWPDSTVTQIMTGEVFASSV
jgi:hypothetical protein